MGGIVGGTPTDLTLQTTTVGAGQDVKLADVTVDNAIFADLMVSASTNASSSEDLEVYLVKVVDTVVADNKYLVLSVDKGGASKDLNFPLEPGVYELRAKNNDSTYDATVSSAKLKLYTYQA